MKHLYHFLVLSLLCIGLAACSKSATDPLQDKAPEPETALYFPPVNSGSWETISPDSLNWNADAESALESLLSTTNTKAFVVLKNGKIVLEWYFGDHSAGTSWYWASAGKTLTAFTVGIAESQEFLSRGTLSSVYLGTGWTSAPLDKENQITIENQLTMTSGLDEAAFDCITSDCLSYMADAGSRWAYHNGPYTLLQNVVSSATASNWTDYFNENLRDPIGMEGFWFSTNSQNNVYFSTARSMARFGLLILNEGIWDQTPILNNANYFQQMTNSSQSLNPSYGYLWWLNGKEGYKVPSVQTNFSGPLIPSAPSDLIAGLGKNDQKLYVVPSQGLVIVRMGEDSGEGLLGPSGYDDQLWQELSRYMNL